MKSHSILFAGLFLAAAVSGNAFAQNARILNAKDPTLEWEFLDGISRGANVPTTVQSISVREAEFYGIAPGTARGNASSGSAGLPAATFVRPKLSVQPFVIGWDGLDLSDNMKNASLIDRLRFDDPILLLGLSFGSESFYGTTELDFGTDSLARYASETGITGFWKPADYLSYWTFPEEGYLAWSDHHVTLAAGRLRTGIGLGKTNIFLNGDARWYDQLQLSWWAERFRFFSFWATSSSQLFDDEYDVQKYTNPNSSSDADDWGWDTINNHDAATQSVVPLKMFTYHRFEFKPISRVGIGIAEMQLVGGKVPDVLNLVPTVAWHNAYSAGVTNVMLQADVWSVPLDGLLVWGEYVMDDSRAPKESGASKPNCWAWELGARAALPIDSARWRYALDLEYSHADKWTYDRWQPYLTMYQRQIITGGHRGYDTPLGHPEGGDVDEIDLTFTALTKERHRLEFGYSWICKGPVYLGMIEDNSTGSILSDGPAYIPVYYDYDDYAGPGALNSLLGSTRKYIHAFSANASWPIAKSWDVNAGIDFHLILNAGHIAGHTATETVYKAGCAWNYGKETK